MTAPYTRGAQVPGVGHFNEGVVLEHIRRAPDGTNRARIAQESGLSAQTVSSITRRLISTGLVGEIQGTAAGVGKPAALLRIVPESRFAIGVHLDPAELSAVVLDLSGSVRMATRRAVRDTSPPALMGEITVLVSETMAKAEVDRSAVLGLGVASPGPIDSRRGVVDPPLLTQWDQVPLQQTLEQLSGLPVMIERDVDAAVTGELWLRPENSGDLLFVYYGTGLNSGVALGRQVRRGERGRAGKLAHLWSGSGGSRCGCGKYGCLAHNLSPAEILRRAGASATRRAVQSDTEQREAVTALVRAADDDPVVAAIFAEIGARLAEAVAVLSSYLDLSRVVIGGPMWSTVAPASRAELLHRLDLARKSDRCPDVGLTETGTTDTAAIGAGCLVLDAMLSPRPDALLTR